MKPALGLVAALVLALSVAGPAPAQVIPPQLPAPLPRLPGSQPPPSRPQQQPPRPVPPRPDRPPVPRCDSTGSPFVASGLAVFPCDFPDPMVLRVGGTYYAYGTATGWERGGKTFPVLRSTDLQRWEAVGDALVQEPGWADGHLWAPSVLAARGGYYLYYSGRRRRDGVHCLAVATAAQPAGPFRHRRVIACGDRTARGYIDAAPLVYRRRAYLFFSVDGPRHSISVLPLSRDLLRADGRRRALIRVSRRWHRSRVGETVEAPWPVRRGGRFYIFYSAGCWCSDYRLGWAVATRLTGPYRDFGGNPILRGSAALPAPGSGSVVTRPDGSSVLAFHAWTGVTDYARGGIRTLRTMPLRWRGRRPRVTLTPAATARR